MTKVIIIGEAYYSDLSVGGGPIIPGQPPGVPTHPIYNPPPGIWGGPPLYPDQGLPPGSPGSPSHPWVPPVPPGYWGGIAPPQPTHPIQLPPPGGTPVPPDVMPVPPTPPGELANDIVVQVYKPGQGWTTMSYDIAPSQGQPTPTPHK